MREKYFKKAVEEKLEELSSQTGQFYKGTLRSGQMLESESSIIILGDVNPGAKVIAKGNVIILGSLKGNVYAGANGNEDAFVVALEMAPIQIRIGDTIARSNNSTGKPEKIGQGTMIAFVDDNNIYIEKLDKGTLDDIRL
jgi:septum site-determining protein MinC